MFSGRQEPIIEKFKIITKAEHGIKTDELCPHATVVVRDLQDAGYESYLVGGSVRDLLLGKIPKDFDVATSATPEEVQEVFPRCRLIGRRFRLAHVRQAGALIEVATFRGEATSDNEREDLNGRILRDNTFGTVEEDAIRRDFTINALFLDPVSGEIRDYVGGYQDLADRRLRLIGDPETRYREDPVRLLRAARFVAKLGVEPDKDTAAPSRKLAPLLTDMPPARLFEEVCKLFLTGHALRSMEAMQRFGLSSTLFPTLKKGSGPGKVYLDPLLSKALENTDERIRESKPVTPAFLFAALLWQPVRDKVEELMERGESRIRSLYAGCRGCHFGTGSQHGNSPALQRSNPGRYGPCNPGSEKPGASAGNGCCMSKGFAQHTISCCYVPGRTLLYSSCASSGRRRKRGWIFQGTRGQGVTGHAVTIGAVPR